MKIITIGLLALVAIPAAAEVTYRRPVEVPTVPTLDIPESAPGAVEVRIPAGTLDAALKRLGEAYGVTLTRSDTVPGEMPLGPLRGNYTLRALGQRLRGDAMLKAPGWEYGWQPMNGRPLRYNLWRWPENPKRHKAWMQERFAKRLKEQQPEPACKLPRWPNARSIAGKFTEQQVERLFAGDTFEWHTARLSASQQRAVLAFDQAALPPGMPLSRAAVGRVEYLLPGGNRLRGAVNDQPGHRPYVYLWASAARHDPTARELWVQISTVPRLRGARASTGPTCALLYGH
jgi:hypothetical protein